MAEERRRKAVSELYGRHPDSDIFVVGTGPSIRVFPTSFLDGRVTIGLNRAWQHFEPMYGLTIHPELNIPDFMQGTSPRPGITWVTRHDKLRPLAPEQIDHAEQEYYFFRTDGEQTTVTRGLNDAGREPSWAAVPQGDHLYLWGSIASTGVNLAANLGARNVILVGCDNGALAGNHHAQAQHTRWLGSTPEDRYHDYYEALAEVRAAVRERGVNVVSVHPFLTLGPHEEDFSVLCEELGQPAQVEPLGDITPRVSPPWRRLVRRVRGTANRP